MEERKYILTDETKEVDGHILHRIKAVKSFGRVKKGDTGGWVESENNLLQEGNCWIFDDAMVYGDAKVYDDAKIYRHAIVRGNAKVYGNAHISGFALIYGHAEIYGSANVFDYAEVFGKAKVFENAKVYITAMVYGNAEVFDYASIFGNAEICGDAKIASVEDYTVFKNNWSDGHYFTWTKSNNMWKEKWFYGTGEELIANAYKTNEKYGKCYEAIVNAIKIISNID